MTPHRPVVAMLMFPDFTHLDLVGPQATGSGVDTLISMERLIGSPFNDTLHGSAAADFLDGGGGIDTLSYARAKSAVNSSIALRSLRRM